MSRVHVVADADEAVAGVQDGTTVLIGGFGPAGQPVALIDAVRRSGVSRLTVVNNNAGNGDTGLAALLAGGQVRRIICSFPRQSDSYVFDGLYRSGEIELEVVPQGTLAERIRAGGAGIGAFFTPTGAGTILAEGKETRTMDGRDQVLEYAITGDLALVKAFRADRMGNLVYHRTARNFGPVMATAATVTAVQVDEVVEVGALDPEVIVTPGIYVNRVVAVGEPVVTTEHLERGPLDRHEMARIVARDIPDGSFVNLGIGQPTLVSDYLDPESGVVLHTENGMLGMGPVAVGDEIDLDLVNAGKVPVTELPGASYFHHADSFAMMRGGHLDVCVLGAFQVAANGDLANWHTGADDAIPAVGGAMDLATGAKDVYVMMTLFAKDGSAKLVPECTYPLTGLACVSKVFTDHAVFLIADGQVTVRETFGISLEGLRARLTVPLLAR